MSESFACGCMMRMRATDIFCSWWIYKHWKRKKKLTWTLVWSVGFSLLLLISQSCAFAFFSSPTTRLLDTGCFSACANTDPSEETGSCCRPGCPGRLAVCWLAALCFSFSFSPSSISAPLSDGLPFLERHPLAIDKGPMEWSPRTSEGAVSETKSTEVDFFLPGAFFEARVKIGSSVSLPSTVNKLEGAVGEPSGEGILLFFSESFLPSRLFSFSFSRFFSKSLSFSFGDGSWEIDTLLSLAPFPAPRTVSWALGGKFWKRGEEELEVFDEGGGFPAVPLLLSVVPWDARLRDTLEKVLNGAGFKALVASGIEETPCKELGLLVETEPVSTDVSEDPFLTDNCPPIWLLRLVIEWEGDRRWPRDVAGPSCLLRLEIRFELGDVWCGEREPGLLPEDECRVTDSKIREWASLGVKRGGRSNGLRFWTGASKRDEEGCWWWVCECRGAKRRFPVPAALLGAGKGTVGLPPAPLTPWRDSPTSSAVRGGGRKLSNMGLRISPSLAYLAEEKYWCSGWDREVQRKVGSLKIERFRLSDKPERTDDPGIKGGTGWDIQVDWAWCSVIAAVLEEADWGSCGGVRSGGGGGEDEDEAVDEACWELTKVEDISTPVGGLMIGFFATVASVSRGLWFGLSRLTPWPLRPRRFLSCKTCSGSGSEGGEGSFALCNKLAFLSPCKDGEWSSVSDKACVASEAWESHDESSKLGLLDLEDSAEESWEECWDTALEPQDAALLLNRPLVALLALVFSRLGVVDWTLGEGAGGGGGGRLSVGAPELPVVTLSAEDTCEGAGEDEVVGWEDADTADVAVSNRAIFRWGVGVPKLPSSSIKRLGVLMMRRETVLTTGIINCLMFFSWVFLMPASMAPVPLLPLATASFSRRFCAPFLARWSSCLAIVASVRFEEGTILTGFRWRGLFLRPIVLPGLEEAGEAAELQESWSSISSTLLGMDSCSPTLALKVLCFPSPHSMAADRCAAPAAAAASAFKRSAEGGRPRLRRGTPGKVLRRDLRGESLVALSLFRLLTLASPRPPLGSCASLSFGWEGPNGALLALFLSSSVSTPSSDPSCLLSSATVVLQHFLLLEDGGRPLLFSPVPGGLPGSLLIFSAGLSGPSGFDCVEEGREVCEGKLGADLCAVRTRGGRPLGFFSCGDGVSDKIGKKNHVSLYAMYYCTCIENIIHKKDHTSTPPWETGEITLKI